MNNKKLKLRDLEGEDSCAVVDDDFSMFLSCPMLGIAPIPILPGFGAGVGTPSFGGRGGGGLVDSFDAGSMFSDKTVLSILWVIGLVGGGVSVDK